MKLYALLLAGSVMALPAIAAAQPVDGLYVGAGFGANWAQNQTIKGGFPGTAHDNPKFETGYEGLASIGWGFGNGLRAEVEGDFRNNRLRSISGIGAAAGQQEQYGAFGNVLYDIDVAPYGISFMAPYVGVGAGYLQNDWHKVTAGAPPATLTVNHSADGVAVQGIVGAAFPLDDALPGLSVTAEYRIMDMPSDRKYSADVVTPAGTVGGKLKVSDDFNHSVLIGLRYAFNVPQPPPPPAPTPAPVAAPAPAPARTYLVFFDWDKSDLTDRAKQIIAEAAQNSTHVQYTRIEVNGYTDLSGTAAYNLKLSVRRATAVEGELVRDGVPQSAIDIHGYGEDHPLVPTAAGVREPQNRRVEIILK
jgi:outer membrane protein OmpA-like peptidoglycan-associated protein